jgi:hypothetical protein
MLILITVGTWVHVHVTNCCYDRNKQGIDTESDYPYTGEEGECIQKNLNKHVITIDGYEDVPANDEVCVCVYACVRA